MKIRSGVLVACMVVVPAMAMFSHHVRLPAGVGDAIRSIVASATRITPADGRPTAKPAAVDGPTPVDVAAVRARLGELGASMIECRSLPGSRGTHVASCRIAVDSHGELERVFHATAPTPEAALRDLLDDVETWRDRVAARRTRPGPTAAF